MTGIGDFTKLSLRDVYFWRVLLVSSLCLPQRTRRARAGRLLQGLAGMLRHHCELSRPPRAMSAASLPLKFSLTCKQPRRNPLSFCHILAAVLSVRPRPRRRKQCPVRIAGWEAEILSGLQKCPLGICCRSCLSLPFRRYPAIQMPRWAEPRDGAGCFPLPHSAHSTPENTAFILPCSSALGRLRISNIHLPWREGTAVGFKNSFMFSFSSAEEKYLLGSIS